MYGSRNKIQSLKPELNGLFCERIFGPINDFECSCGKKPTNSQKFCPTCNVEFTYSKVRRYRLGFIQLFSPTTHAWYLKGRPSYISILLNFSRREAESLAYCTDFLIGSIFPTGSRLMFYQFPSSTDLSLKFRYLKKIKNKLFINSASQPLNLDKIGRAHV